MVLPPPHRHVLGLALALLVAVLAAVITPEGLAVGASTRWHWPLDPPHRIVRPYLAPDTPYSSGHRGIDVAGAAGAPVYAPADGVVHFAGFVVDRPVLSIRHAGGVLSSLEPVDAVVTAGDAVRRGQVVGFVADAVHHCSSPCLHLGVRRDGEYVSPLLYLGGLERAVLLPTRSIP